MRKSTRKLMRGLAANRRGMLNTADVLGLPSGRGSKARKSVAHGLRLRRKVKGAAATRKWAKT